jgi:hypothetical protein
MPKKKKSARKTTRRKAAAAKPTRRKSAPRKPARKLKSRRSALKKIPSKGTFAALDGEGTMDPPDEGENLTSMA